MVMETSNETSYCSLGKWKGKDAWVIHQEIEHCPGHVLHVVNDEHGEPTGFLLCDYCGGVANDDACRELYEYATYKKRKNIIRKARTEVSQWGRRRTGKLSREGICRLRPGARLRP